jgi:hypothetical protein
MSPQKTDPDLEGALYQEVPIGDNLAVRLYPGHVDFVRYFHRQGELYESTSAVVMGRFKPIRKLQLDGEEVFEVITTSSFRGNAEEIHQELKRQGLVVNRAKAADAVNALFQGLNLPTEKGHATYGVFEDDGKPWLCLDPYPRTESQAQIVRQIDRHKNTKLTKENLGPWFDVTSFWHRYEVYPAMGLSVMAPFALELRRRGIMFGYLYHLSPESGLGKTEISRIFTRQLFGNELLSADSIKSEYRLMDCLDSAGLMVAVQEAEALPWEKFSAHLQMAAEQPLQDKRGTPGLGSRPYWSRAMILFTGNHFPTKRKALLVRFLVLEFDRTKLGERRKNRKKLRKVIKQLKPIGFRVVEAELESLRSIEELVNRVEGHGDKIEEVYIGGFEDPRRATFWGIVYEGLIAWELAATKAGINWKAPTYEDFVKQVVNLVEPTAFQSVEVPATAFISWWNAWKALNSDREGNIKGHGEIWTPGRLNGVDGDIITKSVLTIYERDCRHNGTIPVNSLPDLARGIEALYELSFADVYKKRKLGGNSLWTVFVPSQETERSTKLTEPRNQEKKPGPDGGSNGAEGNGTKPTGTKKPRVPKFREKIPLAHKKISGETYHKIKRDFISYLKTAGEPVTDGEICTWFYKYFNLGTSDALQFLKHLEKNGYIAETDKGWISCR